MLLRYGATTATAALGAAPRIAPGRRSHPAYAKCGTAMGTAGSANSAV